MKLNEMKKLIKKAYTPSQLKKEVNNLIKYANDPTLDIRVYTGTDDNLFFANLMIDVWDGEEYRDVTPFTIEIEDAEMDFWEFKELAEKALAPKKKNLIEKEFCYYKIGDTTDYNM